MSSNLSDDMCIVVTGDDHLGHPRTCTSKILTALLTLVPDTPKSNEIDLLVINGDLFDSPMSLTSNYRSEIIITFLLLLNRCKKYNICLRVVEGTPSHDYKQSKILIELNTDIEADCKYVDTLSIEYNEKFNSYWLFVPDEWRASALDTQEEVKHLLTANRIEKVDYAFMHGYFHYQLPDIATEEAHDIHFYSSIVKNNIFINHVHLFSENGKVVAPGSLERLSHGEEGAKGHVVRKKEGIRFIINKEATKYVTVNCVSLPLEEAVKKIENLADTLPKGSYIRIKANKSDTVFSTISYFRNKYRFIGWETVRGDKKDKKTVSDNPVVKVISKIPTITKENIESFLIPRIKDKNPLLLDKCLTILRETVNER